MTHIESVPHYEHSECVVQQMCTAYIDAFHTPRAVSTAISGVNSIHLGGWNIHGLSHAPQRTRVSGGLERNAPTHHRGFDALSSPFTLTHQPNPPSVPISRNTQLVQHRVDRHIEVDQIALCAVDVHADAGIARRDASAHASSVEPLAALCAMRPAWYEQKSSAQVCKRG
jgi:hypothetical protein